MYGYVPIVLRIIIKSYQILYLTQSDHTSGPVWRVVVVLVCGLLECCIVSVSLVHVVVCVTVIATDGVSVKQVGDVGGATVTPSASTGSWVGRVPGSFVPEPPPQEESPSKQAKTSPSKVSW